MLRTSLSIISLLLGTAILLIGIGLQGTLIGLRANVEQFPLATTGLVMSAYFFGFVLGAHFCPPLIHRVGHIRAFAVMATIASAAAVAYAIWVDPLIWGLLRVLTGICMVGLYMVIESWLNSVAPSHLRGQIFSIYMAVTLLAMAGGQYLLLLGEVAGFELFGIITILLSLALVPITMTRLQQPELVISARLKLASLYATSPLGVVATLAAGMVTGAFWGMMPLYGESIGLDDLGVAVLMSATITGGVLLQWPIGLLSDHIDRRKVIVMATLIAAVLALLGFLMGQHVTLPLYVVAFLFGGFVFSLYGLSVAHVNDHIETDQVLEATRSLLQLYGVGAMLGPSLAGQGMSRFGPGALLLFIALVLGTLLLFALLRMQRREAVPVAEQGEFVAMGRTSPVALEMAPLAEEGTEENHG
ncbi:MFS transporter [Sulfuriflexus sp.]|uniref:MFS transporter n=1 Tax=Sulfuriflexus sp. TaxID=2015443 RepID=UPI0028CE7B79|nr:MFS transporter [Sulfuriflexus sp.]MDT8404962.1 MFS transporter [Sulfuriflexus sp.]